MAELYALEQNEQKVEGERSRGDAPAATMGADLKVAQAHAQWWSPELKPKLEVNPSAAADSVGGAISAWVAYERNRILGQKLYRDAEDMHADLANEGKVYEKWRFRISLMYSRRSGHARCRNTLPRLAGF